MKFEQLLTLFQETHRELQKRAAQSVDIALGKSGDAILNFC